MSPRTTIGKQKYGNYIKKFLRKIWKEGAWSSHENRKKIDKKIDNEGFKNDIITFFATVDT